MNGNGLLKKLATKYGDFIRYAEVNGNTYCDITDYERARSHRKKIEALSYYGLNHIEEHNYQTENIFKGAAFCDFDQIDWESKEINSIIASLERISPTRILEEQFQVCDVYDNGEIKDTTQFEYDAISTIMKRASELTEDEFIEWIYNGEHGLVGEIYQDEMVLDWCFCTDTDEGFIHIRVYKGVKLSGEILLGEGVGAKYLYCEDIPLKKDSYLANNEDFILYTLNTYFGDSIRYIHCDGYRYYSQEDWDKYYNRLHQELKKCADNASRRDLCQKIQQWEKDNTRLYKVADEMFSIFDDIKWKRWSKKRIQATLKDNASMGCNNELREYLNRSYSHPTYTLKNILDREEIKEAFNSGLLALLEKSGMTKRGVDPHIYYPKWEEGFTFKYGTINSEFFISKENLINLAFRLYSALDQGMNIQEYLEKYESSGEIFNFYSE